MSVSTNICSNLKTARRATFSEQPLADLQDYSTLRCVYLLVSRVSIASCSGGGRSPRITYGCASNDIGCGEQEQYKNCADVVIMPNGVSVNNVTTPSSSSISTVSTATATRPTCPSYDTNTYICVCGSSACQLQAVGSSLVG